MNQGIYKLVYSKVLNMYVPASEAVRGHSNKGSRVRKIKAQKQAKISLKFTIIACFVYTANGLAAPAGLVPGTQAWVNASITGSTSNSLTIGQTAPRAILDWSQLNLQAGELLKFNQQGNSNWSALNRIHDLNPSFINGNVQADGNVYFINTNGVIFGKNAQFNVGSLYAGTLDITDNLFNSGFVNANTFTNVFGDGITGIGGFVTVEQGAQINTISGGKVLLFAPTVTNNGVINTPEGQTILAAGNKVYLQSSADPAGFLVEVSSGGTATNLGQIVAERGNITMMGLAVNQSGILTATTSVRANGTIYLQANNNVTAASGTVTGDNEGMVTLAKGSVTQVNPDASTETIIASQAFKTSAVNITGSLINIDGTVSAKNGNVSIDTHLSGAFPIAELSALSNNPYTPPIPINLTASRIYLGNDAVIDVSGVDAIAPMSQNQLVIQLFSDQLKDAPILRNGGLFKQTVYVDARKGTALFDISPYLALVGETVSERMTNAGTISLSTPTDLIVSKGAVLNVSGGSTTYQAGTVKETNLFYNGKLVPISQALPGVPYDTVADTYAVNSSKWGVTRAWDITGGTTQGWGDVSTTGANNQLLTTVVGSQVASYFMGGNAGTVNLTAPDGNGPTITNNSILAGQFLANTKISTQQLINQTIPTGGILIASANQLEIVKNVNAAVDFGQTLPSNYQSAISNDFLGQGFNTVDLSKVNSLVVDNVMNLKPSGSLTLGNKLLTGSTAQINADIIAPSSNINLNSGVTSVADNVKISSAGSFTNDKAGVAGQYSQPLAINGGNINAGILSLGKNVILDASAGASVNNQGVLAKGTAGNIQFGTLSKIDDSVTFQSYGFKQGGNLSVTYGLGTTSQAETVNIAGNSNASATGIDIASSFFSQGGFSKYSLSGFNVNIGDSSGAPQEIYAAAQTWQMNSGFVNQVGGQPMSLVASPFIQPDTTRSPVSFNFSANQLGGVLNLAENTTLRTDRGGSVSLSAGKQVNVLGDITTPGGNININISDIDTSSSQLYDPTQAVFIGGNAILSAAGSSITLPSSQPNLLKTQVFNAGTISIDVPKGAVVVKEGGLLDVSGTSIVNDTKTPTGYMRETLYGDAGSIKLSASDGLLLDGTFMGASTGTGRGGTLNLGFTNTQLTAPPILSGNRQFTITQQKQLLAQNFAAGDALKTSTGLTYSTTSADTLNAHISADQVQQGGFANLNVQSFIGDTSSGLNNSIQLANGLNLQMTGNLQLTTPLINVQNDGAAKLGASYITVQSPNSVVDATAILTGNGSLTTQSKQLSFNGLTAVSGVNTTNFNTSLDVNGQGTQQANNGSFVATAGGIIANGDINLTARQIYPNSGSILGFEALGNNSKITINSNGVVANPALSAQGELNLTANDIVQNGVLTAPFGQINFNASNSVTFTAGSVTSISANNQLIPYGTTSTGGVLFNANAGVTTTPINKGINVNSSGTVNIQKNAVLDMSAGGDMFAYEWVPGIGGSADVLAQPNTYAVIPNFGQNYAPVDQVYSGSSVPVGVGKSVYLTGVPGLATGTYTLLPSRYALVPGAFMVRANVASNLLPTQTASLLNGSTLTTGYFADLGTGAHDANWSTFSVTNGSIFYPAVGALSQSPSQYIITSANTYFSNPVNTGGLKVSLPEDVGTLSVSTAQLALNGHVVANKVAGGAGLNVDISSANIEVVSSVGANDGSLQLTADSLNALNADSLLLGGTRSLQNGVVDITTDAQTVSIQNDNNHVIYTPELIATATNSVTVKTGAVIDTGIASKTPATTVVMANGDGALLAASSASDISYSRVGSSATSAKGILDIQAGSTLKAGNSVVLDATQSASIASNVTLQDGGNATFGANRILIGNAPTNLLGLNINASALAALGQLKSLTLNSYNDIDTFGAVNFGNNKLNLTLNAAGIVGHLANGEISVPPNATPSIITAGSFTLENKQGAAFTAPTDASGRGLEIDASVVKLGGGNAVSGATEIAGYSNLNVNANEIRVANQGTAYFNVADATLTTGRITADTASKYNINANNLTIASLPGAQLPVETGFGASLGIAATNLTVAGNVDLSSGTLSLTSINDLNIQSGATISANSTANTFYNTTVNAPAGSITLTSNTGNVNVNTGAVVDVASLGAAKAGLVNINASSGTANIMGSLKGAATGTGIGGQLNVDVNTLANISVTNSHAIGFDTSRQYRVRTGDVSISGTVANSNPLSASNVVVSADAGQITVSGDIIATSPVNGHVGLFAGNGVTLASTANLKANSSQAGASGGLVEIDTAANQLDFNAGSSIDVSGSVGGTGGSVTMRAPRTGADSGNGVAVSNFATNIIGSASSQLEAYRTFNNVTSIISGSGTGATLGFTTIANDVNNFMTNQSSILASLGKTGDSTFHLQAGTDIQSTGNLIIGSDWNLYSTTRTGGEPGEITLQAKGNITFNGSLSDGFTTAATTGVIGTANSDSYKIVAGADFSAANPLVTLASAKDISGNALTGNVIIANNKMIRTGTGSIDIATGGDLKMGTTFTPGSNTGSVIYTAGVSAPTLAGFNAPSANLAPLYLTNGGNISISTKGNIVGGESSTTGRQLINEWLYRQGGGSGNLDTSWWVRPDLFKQSLATMGGGNIYVEAAGNISNFSASAPTTAQFDTNGTTGNQVINGGGNVTVSAGGNINNGVYFVANGVGDVTAGGSIQKLGNTFGTTLALQNGRFNVSAGKNVYIETAINPTLVSQSVTNATAFDSTGKNSYFNSYSPQAEVDVSSLNGDVVFGGGSTILGSTGVVAGLSTTAPTNSLTFIPSTIKVVSYNGDATLGNVTLLPSAMGDLEVLAANNINLGNVSMSDADPALLPGINNPVIQSGLAGTSGMSAELLTHATQLLHQNDALPALVVAENGSISPTGNGPIVTLPKATKFVAGADVNGLQLSIQNNNESDITLIKAGNDVRTQNVTVSGPGNVLVQAGRSIDLVYPSVTAIETTGSSGSSLSVFGSLNTANPALPADGASITLQAGLGSGANVQGYISQYILPTGAGPATIAGNANELAQYHAATASALTAYMQQITGNNTLTDAESLTLFNNLNLEAKTIFVNKLLSSELVASAKDFAQTGNEERGYLALAELFPTNNPGDISLFNSKISTNSGGSIDLLAPGGLINVGVPGQGGDIGVITQQAGDIRAIAGTGFNVNQSKVITQFGGNITIWSTDGTIDAGRGSKTATSIPVRIVQTDAFGNTTVVVNGVATGSGIRAQTYDPDGPNGPLTAPPQGTVALIAPVVDASEAGIQAGNLLIAAPVVLNAMNIQVSGTSSGVPVAATSSLSGVSAGLSPDSVNSATAAISQSVAQSANQPLDASTLPSIISVDVISIGK